jgi:hypothetical protein
VWSTHYGYLLTSINLQYTLADLLVSCDGSRMIGRFEDCTGVPILALTHKIAKEASRTISHSSFKSFESKLINNFFFKNDEKIK